MKRIFLVENLIFAKSFPRTVWMKTFSRKIFRLKFFGRIFLLLQNYLIDNSLDDFFCPTFFFGRNFFFTVNILVENFFIVAKSVPRKQFR